MTEYLLSTNDFGEPTVLKDNSARGINILRLLILTPGHNPLFPEMGCNLIKYRHIMSDELPKLKTLVETQIETYLPECLLDSVELQIVNGKYINIIIQCQDGVTYTYDSTLDISPVSLEVVY
jgi:hypothetical protein